MSWMLLVEGLFFLSVVLFVQAYIIDDTNSTVQYSGGGLGWAHYVNDSSMDSTKLFNATWCVQPFVLSIRPQLIIAYNYSSGK